jgi:methylated-DNA-[protein]-cysteine S-methyltransferase
MTSAKSESSAQLETATIEIPGGELSIVVDPVDGAVVASGFAALDEILALLPSPERERGHQNVAESVSMTPVLQACARYRDGEFSALDAVLVRQPEGPFVAAARTELRAIPAGEVDTYAGLAARAGRPAAVRAAGQACAKNRVAPFVPCHRIVRTDGSLGGYAYGLPVKIALLEHEGADINVAGR